MSDWIVNTIAEFGYLGIVLLMLVEAVFPPIPSELIIPFSGFAVSQGRLDFVLVVLAATAGSLLGAVPCPAGRQVCLFVPAQEAAAGRQQCVLAQQGDQFGVRIGRLRHR